MVFKNLWAFSQKLWTFLQNIDSYIVSTVSQNDILAKLAYDNNEECQFSSNAQLQIFISIERLWNHSITKGYRFLVKGWYEIFWRHFVRDVVTDTVVSWSLGQLMQMGNKNKINWSSCACCPEISKPKSDNAVLCQPVSIPKKTHVIITEAIYKSCVIKSERIHTKYTTSPVEKNLYDVYPDYEDWSTIDRIPKNSIRLKSGNQKELKEESSKPSNNIFKEFKAEIIFHGKIKALATVAFPLVHYAFKNIDFLNNDSMDRIEPAINGLKQIAEYIAINPDELMFLSDSIINILTLKKRDLITNFATESEVELRRGDQEFSDFMNAYNEWMEIVDGFVHLIDYYRNIFQQFQTGSDAETINYFDPELFRWFGSLEWMEIVDGCIHLIDYYKNIFQQSQIEVGANAIKYFYPKLAVWFISLHALKQNTDVKQAALEEKYIAQPSQEIEINESSQDFYKSVYLGSEPFYHDG